MGKSIQQLIDQLPADRKATVEANAQRMAAEMIAEADSLADMRKAVGKTQADLGKTLGIKQNAVSQLESRAEMYVSTLRKYVEALGMKLQISLLTNNGERIDIPNFHPWDNSTMSATDAPGGRVARRTNSSARATAVATPSRRTASAARGKLSAAMVDATAAKTAVAKDRKKTTA